MATKDGFIPLQDKKQQRNFNDNSLNGNSQYSNLNLNSNNKCSQKNEFRSKSISNDSRKKNDYATKKVSDQTFVEKSEKQPKSWNKKVDGIYSMKSDALTIDNSKNKNETSEKKNKNASTLSLHIAAYENYIEAGNDLQNLVENDGKKLCKFGETLKAAGSSTPMNQFEFPRQQTDDETDPAVMQFTASQRLLNPNQSDARKNVSNQTDMSEVYKTFMSVFRKWAELKLQKEYNKKEREEHGIKKWKELQNNLQSVKLQITAWTSETEKHKASNSILGFFSKASSSSSTTPLSLTPAPASTPTPTTNDIEIVHPPSTNKDTPDRPLPARSTVEEAKPTPAQESILKIIEDLQNEYNCINKKNFKTEEDTGKEKLLLKKIKQSSNKLKELKAGAEYSRQYRQKLKAKRATVTEPPPKIAMVRPGTVEQRLLDEGINISLQDAIVELVTHGGAAEQKRQADLIRSCTTLDSLKENLLKHFNICIARSTLYTRLLPRDSRTIEGRRHFNCAPVRLLKPQNDLMKDHQDGQFASATVRQMKDFSSIMGPKAVNFLSQDDKARISLGLPAVQNQTRVAMHVQYRIKLPDHDWMVAAKHKLIPSVYASCIFGPDGHVGVNGPTYCAIRSGKHDHSGADSHLQDFHRLIELEEFSKEMMDENDELKPILLVTVDGGPDENPRYPKTLSAWSSVFIQYNLDMLIVATHAPGQSAYNAVERRMAPLSKALSGVILPYDTYGSHLNASHKTVDDALELRNFTAAGEALAEIWSEMSIANFPVRAEFISPDSEKPILNERSEKWIYDHVLQTQYCLQISKCSNEKCCEPPKTSAFSVLNGRFLPPPAPFSFDLTGPVVDDKNGHYGSLANRILYNSMIPKEMIFDSFCPSVKKDLKSRICDDCGKYFATKKAKLSHRKSQVCKESDEYLLESESDEETTVEEFEEKIDECSTEFPIIDPSCDPDAYINVFENLSI